MSVVELGATGVEVTLSFTGVDAAGASVSGNVGKTGSGGGLTAKLLIE
jgi:hypothetical protein